MKNHIPAITVFICDYCADEYRHKHHSNTGVPERPEEWGRIDIWYPKDGRYSKIACPICSDKIKLMLKRFKFHVEPEKEEKNEENEKGDN